MYYFLLGLIAVFYAVLLAFSAWAVMLFINVFFGDIIEHHEKIRKSRV